MKRLFLSVALVFLQSFILSAQSTGTITGRLVDQNGNGLSGLQLQLYISPNVYNTTSGSDGSFTFNNITDVKEEELPTGYAVSNNYPNPFNPKTRIGITLPNSGRVRVDVYNLLGQRVREEIEKYFSPGESYIDLELNGLSNGFYLARITLDDKYVVTKKLMLLYGSQHLSSSSGGLFSRLNKTTMDGNTILDTKIDSLVVTGPSIAKKVFTNLQSMIGNSLNLGNLIITLPVPDAPTLSSPVDGATDVSLSPILYWNVSFTATSYTLQVSTNSSFTSYVFNQSGLTNTNQPISGLSYFTKYYWRVNAAKNNSASNWSSTWSFNTFGTIPQTPTLETPTNNATSISTSPTFTWNASIGATSYALQVSANSSFSSFVYNQSVLTSTSQQIAGLSNSTQYYWRVNATNNYGTSSWSSTWSFTTIVTVPFAPILSSPANGSTGTSTTLTLYWNVNTIASSYTLQVSTQSNFSSFVFNQSGLINTNQTLNGLSGSTPYYWRVNATNNYGTSNWSSTWTFMTINGSCTEATVTYEGKVYNTIQIGVQCWLKENLDIGTMIQGSVTSSNNGSIEKYCFGNNPNNCNIYGGLYQWDEAMQYAISGGKVQGICPPGWHLPTLAEFQILSTTVNNNSNALKAIGQGTGSGVGTNTSGFSALVAGLRPWHGTFMEIIEFGFWSSTETNATDARGLYLQSFDTSLTLGGFAKSVGFSIRCIKD